MPTTPALASNGARLIPRSPSTTTPAIVKIVTDAALRKTEPSARTRWLATLVDQRALGVRRGRRDRPGLRHAFRARRALDGTRARCGRWAFRRHRALGFRDGRRFH